MIKKILFVLAFCSLLGFWACQDHERLNMSKRVDFLVKDTVLYEHFLMDFDGIGMYANEEAKQKANGECKLYYNETDAFSWLLQQKSVDEVLSIYQNKRNTYFDATILQPAAEYKAEDIIASSDEPLGGLRIAIDPAYIGGSIKMAELERKLIKVKEANGDTTLLDEGLINLGTALILEVKLRKLGADVHITRTERGKSVFGKTFFQWLQDDFRSWVKSDLERGELTQKEADFLRQKADVAYVFNQYFRPKELKKRVEVINNFKPHMTIGVSYNIDEPNWQRRYTGDLLTPTLENYSLVYVPGAFMAGELSKPRDRMEFLRLLSTQDYANSVILAKHLSEQFTHQLASPPLPATKQFDYLEMSSVKVASGIYARNLYLTKLIHGAVCYIAPVCLDNQAEFQAITKQELKVKGLITSKRAEKVADATISAILSYFAPPSEAPLGVEEGQ